MREIDEELGLEAELGGSLQPWIRQAIRYHLGLVEADFTPSSGTYCGKLLRPMLPRTPRYFAPATVVEDTPERLMLFTRAGARMLVGAAYRREAAAFHYLSILWPSRYYNAVIVWSPGWSFVKYYVNLAMPPTWDGSDACEYVDLELDLELRRGESVVRMLDEEEYLRRSPSYPAELLPRLEHAICEATTMLAERVFPFDDTLLGWRPGGA